MIKERFYQVKKEGVLITSYDFTHFPPSYSYIEIINKIKVGEVAYCYLSNDERRRGAFVILINGSLRLINPNGEHGIIANFELWSFLHEIPNGEIRQEAINRWYHFYNIYFEHLDLEDYKFKLNIEKQFRRFESLLQ